MSLAGPMRAPCRAGPGPARLGTSRVLTGSIQDGLAELNGLPVAGLP